MAHAPRRAPPHARELRPSPRHVRRSACTYRTRRLRKTHRPRSAGHPGGPAAAPRHAGLHVRASSPWIGGGLYARPRRTRLARSGLRALRLEHRAEVAGREPRCATQLRGQLCGPGSVDGARGIVFLQVGRFIELYASQRLLALRVLGLRSVGLPRRDFALLAGFPFSIAWRVRRSDLSAGLSVLEVQRRRAVSAGAIGGDLRMRRLWIPSGVSGESNTSARWEASLSSVPLRRERGFTSCRRRGRPLPRLPCRHHLPTLPA